MKCSICSLLVLGLVAFAPIGLAKGPEGLNNLDDALKKAKDESKLLFIKSGRQSCGNCQALAELIRSKKLRLPEKDFVFVDLNCDDPDQDRPFSQRYNLGGGTLPFVVIADSDGELLCSRKGYGEKKDFDKLIQEAKKKAKEKAKLNAKDAKDKLGAKPGDQPDDKAPDGNK